MRIKRLRLVLPARMKDTAHHDARQIAERLAERVYQTGSNQREITLSGQGQTAAMLGVRVSQSVRSKGNRHGR